MLEALQNKENIIALIGASNDPKKYGNKIFIDLLAKGYIVYPINNTETQIQGIKSHKKCERFNSKNLQIINFVIPPDEGLKVTKDLVQKGYDNFWYQPGADSREISEFLIDENKNFIDDKCIMIVTRLSDNY